MLATGFLLQPNTTLKSKKRKFLLAVSSPSHYQKSRLPIIRVCVGRRSKEGISEPLAVENDGQELQIYHRADSLLLTFSGRKTIQ